MSSVVESEISCVSQTSLSILSRFYIYILGKMTQDMQRDFLLKSLHVTQVCKDVCSNLKKPSRTQLHQSDPNLACQA